jgi:PBSX family phage terminase large subunit
MNNLTADNIKSFEGFHDAWVEEAQNFSIHSAQLLLPTIRQPNSQITFTMNRKRVKDDIIDYVEKTYINRYLKIYINYLENPFLSDDARQEAEDCRNNKPDDWKRDWLGIPDDNFNKRVTKNFCNDNIADIIYQPSMHLHITCDFNKDPCCWELAHKGENVAFFFDEICLENTTVAKMCNEFINRYPNHTEDIIINGDASGKSSNVGMDAVFYAQMLNILRAKYGYKKVYLKIKKANPSTNERVESWNNMILTNKGERNVLISPKCKWLLYNIYNLEYKDGTSLINTPSINSLSKDPTLKFLGHPFDAASYMIDFYWSIKLNTLGYNPEKYVYKDPFFERLKNK